MNTEVKMIRKLDNFEIKQRNTDEYFVDFNLIPFLQLPVNSCIL